MTRRTVTPLMPECLKHPGEDARHLARQTGMQHYQEIRRCARFENLLERWPLLAAIAVSAPAYEEQNPEERY